MESPDRAYAASGAIRYPSLREMLAPVKPDLHQMGQALDRVNHFAFGAHNTMLAPHERRHRLNLYKFVNLLRYLDLLPDVEVFELGYRCPEQLRAYHLSLKHSIQRAYARGLDRNTLHLAEEAHLRLWQVEQAVTQFYDGLS